MTEFLLSNPMPSRSENRFGSISASAWLHLLEAQSSSIHPTNGDPYEIQNQATRCCLGTYIGHSVASERPGCRRNHHLPRQHHQWNLCRQHIRRLIEYDV